MPAKGSLNNSHVLKIDKKSITLYGPCYKTSRYGNDIEKFLGMGWQTKTIIAFIFYPTQKPLFGHLSLDIEFVQNVINF